MNKKLLIIGAVAVVLLGGVILWRQIGRKSAVYKTADGTVTVEQRGDDDAVITHKSDKGEVTIATRKLTEAELGVAIYPGAKQDEGGSLTFSGKNDEGKISGAVFSTEDPFEKVLAFYKEKLGPSAQAMELSSDEERSALITRSDEASGESTQVLITQEKGSRQTKINISHSSK